MLVSFQIMDGNYLKKKKKEEPVSDHVRVPYHSLNNTAQLSLYSPSVRHYLS